MASIEQIIDATIQAVFIRITTLYIALLWKWALMRWWHTAVGMPY